MWQAWRQWWRGPGGTRDVVRIAWPLVVSNSFWTLQIAIDRILLSRADSDAVGAAITASLLFWTPLTLLQFTVNYATTFVAQYSGAGVPRRVGPTIWQALYLALLGGLAFLPVIPWAESIVAIGEHAAPIQRLEAIYLRCLCYSALPLLITAAVTSFFTGLGHSRTVMLINASGLLCNIALAYPWIYGRWGFPAWGIAGAGWATVCGSTLSAILGLGLLWRKVHRQVHGTAAGWRPDPRLFVRLLRFGVPNGLLASLEALGFTLFLVFVGRLGALDLNATSIAWTLNLLVYLPTMGIGQAIGVLVGQHQGEERSDLAARTVWNGLQLALLFTALLALLYLLIPTELAELFHSQQGETPWNEVAALVPMLLRFVTLYALFDTTSLVFSHALRGAGDTRFVSLVTVILAASLMALPAWVASRRGWPLTWPWTFASLYIVVQAVVLGWRFRGGKWRTMRVIESTPVLRELEEEAYIRLPEAGPQGDTAPPCEQPGRSSPASEWRCWDHRPPRESTPPRD